MPVRLRAAGLLGGSPAPWVSGATGRLRLPARGLTVVASADGGSARTASPRSPDAPGRATAITRTRAGPLDAATGVAPHTGRGPRSPAAGGSRALAGGPRPHAGRWVSASRPTSGGPAGTTPGGPLAGRAGQRNHGAAGRAAQRNRGAGGGTTEPRGRAAQRSRGTSGPRDAPTPRAHLPAPAGAQGAAGHGRCARARRRAAPACPCAASARRRGCRLADRWAPGSREQVRPRTVSDGPHGPFR